MSTGSATVSVMDDHRTYEPPDRPYAQPEPVVARLRTPADLVVATPYLVGFRPEASLVVVGTGGPRRRIQVTMRLDLPPDRADPDTMTAVVGCLLEALRRSDAEQAQLLVYPDPGEDPGTCAGRLPRPRLVRLLAEQLVAAGIELLEALCVVPADGADRYWSYLCRDRGCCPTEGSIISEQEALDVRFAFVSAGRTVRPSRSELVASLAPTTDGERTAELLGRVERARTRRPGPGATPDRVRRWRRATSRRLGAALAAAPACGADDVPRLGVGDTALLAVGVADRPVRDMIIAEAVRTGRLDLLTDVLGELVRSLPDRLLAPAAGTLAAVAYCNGDGALAWVAVDRALTADPEESLALLVAELLTRALPPEQLRGFVSLLPSAADWDGEPVPVPRSGPGPRTGTAPARGPNRGARRRAG